jgi:hypothetical protein
MFLAPVELALADEALYVQASKVRQQEVTFMPLTRSFFDTVRARAERDPAFREALFAEAMQALLQGDIDSARSALLHVHQCHVGA